MKGKLGYEICPRTLPDGLEQVGYSVVAFGPQGIVRTPPMLGIRSVILAIIEKQAADQGFEYVGFVDPRSLECYLQSRFSDIQTQCVGSDGRDSLQRRMVCLPNLRKGSDGPRRRQLSRRSE